ncbi:type II secretion system F family protein [Saccharomonospora sp. NB11]|uniref:type II secretion system F family protein n=1 Tax=Saccharomonospora sp. NB11 TaxID=1642298 RepID=UPI001E372809|nr:type II secretion system F family protein [Saccharomonospora sp. NB11]
MDVPSDQAGRAVMVAVVASVAFALLVSPPTAARRLRAAARTGVARKASPVGRFLRRPRELLGRARAVPDDPALALDLLSACLTAGTPVPTAVSAVAEVTTGRTAEVLRATAHALSLGASPDVAWQRARAHPATAELARAACRTASSGSAFAAQAAALAERIRTAEDDRVEARAQRTSVLVAGPLGLCFLPAFFCLGVIPVVVGLASRLHVLP